MNLIPSVRAYIAERIKQLELIKRNPQLGALPDVFNELKSIDALCAGLDKQAAIFDDLVTSATKRSKEKP